MDDVAAIRQLLAGKSRVTMWRATFVGITADGIVQCDVTNGDDTGRVPVQMTTAYMPQVNEQVFVLAIDGTSYYLIGPSVPKPPSGTIATVNATTVDVTTTLGTVTATFESGATLSAGQVVKLYWSGGAHVIGALTPPPAPPDPPAPPVPAKRRHVDVFTANDAGSFSGGRWWQSQPWASDTTLGAWFYGAKIRDTLQGAPVSKVEIWSTLAQRYGSNPLMGTHPHAAKPGGGPAISNATAVSPPNGGWLTLPTSFGQFLAGNVGGIGLAHGGYNKFRSLAEDPQSGALRITSTY